VLFVRPGALGDIICTFPAAEMLKKRHPKAAFLYSCHRDFACLPEMGGITTWTTGAHVAKGSFWSRFFSAVYHFDYGDERPGEVSTQAITTEFCTQHGLPPAEAHPRLQIRPEALARVQSLLANHQISPGSLVLFHVGPTWPVREWPWESWGELARQLKIRGISHLVQLGVDQHVELGKRLGHDLPQVVSLVNQLTIEETVALISLGNLLVGIDSGLLHVAAATRTPAIGIFGPTSPGLRFAKDSSCSFVVSRVECQGCHHRLPRLHWRENCPYNIQCMKTVAVSEVVEACFAKLSSPEVAPQSKV
jgi:ADP-heptose:LPS heptosyltransferase